MFLIDAVWDVVEKEQRNEEDEHEDQCCSIGGLVDMRWRQLEWAMSYSKISKDLRPWMKESIEPSTNARTRQNYPRTTKLPPKLRRSKLQSRPIRLPGSVARHDSQPIKNGHEPLDHARFQ